MNSETALFWIFSAVLLLAAVRVITARNPVHAVLFLVLSFFSTACLWLLLRAEFLAIALVLVYVGAVMVLFLFVVMMLDVNLDRLRAGFWRHFPLGAVVAVVIALQLWAVLAHGHWQALQAPNSAAATDGLPNIEALGMLTFTQYLYPLQIAATLLLVAIIAAIALTLRQRKDARRQVVGEQVRVKRGERVRMVAMAAETDARQSGTTPAAAATAAAGAPPATAAAPAAKP